MNNAPTTLFVGQQHIHLDRVHSTNTYAIDMISKSKPMEGFVISARHQYDGKGQIGRFWDSEEGMNITCSTILYPKFLEATHQFQLNIAYSLAVMEMISSFLDKPAQIKWPNDIYVGDKKIAGMLIQNGISRKWIDYSVLGTGININQAFFDENIPNPTSLSRESGEEFDLQSCLNTLFKCIEVEYLSLKAGNHDKQKRRYLEHLFRAGEWHEYEDKNGNIFNGCIAGVSPTGELSIQRENGHLSQFAFRELHFII